MKKLEAISCDRCGTLFPPTQFRYEFYGAVDEVHSNIRKTAKMKAQESDPLCFCSLKCLVQKVDENYTVEFR